MREEVAERGFEVVTPAGERREARLRIGRPYWHGDREARCDYQLVGLDATRTVSGADTLQALTLALYAACSDLDRFIERGGRVRFGDVTAERSVSKWFWLG